MPAESTTSSEQLEGTVVADEALPEMSRWHRWRKVVWVVVGICLIFLWGESWRHRFDTGAVNLLSGVEFDAASSKSWNIGKQVAPQDISFDQGIATLIKRKGKVSPRASQWVTLSPDQSFLRIRAEVAVDGVYQLKPGWQAPRIQFAGATREGKARQRMPHACGTFFGTQDWQQVDHFIELRPDDERIAISLQNWATEGTYRIRNLELRSAQQQPSFVFRNCLIGAALLVWLICPWAGRAGWLRASLSAIGVLFLCFYTIHPRFHELDVNLWGQPYPEPSPIKPRANLAPEPLAQVPAGQVPKPKNQAKPAENAPKKPSPVKEPEPPSVKQPPVIKKPIPKAKSPAAPEPATTEPAKSAQPSSVTSTNRRVDWLSKFDVHAKYTQFWVYGGMALIACFVAGTWHPALILCFVVLFAELRQALLLYPATKEDAIELGGSILSILIAALLVRSLNTLTLNGLSYLKGWRSSAETTVEEEG